MVERAGVVVLVPVTVPIVGLIEMELAELTFQLKVEVPFGRTLAGDAEKEEMAGRALESVAPEAIVDDAETLPTLSFAVT